MSQVFPPPPPSYLHDMPRRRTPERRVFLTPLSPSVLKNAAVAIVGSHGHPPSLISSPPPLFFLSFLSGIHRAKSCRKTGYVFLPPISLPPFPPFFFLNVSLRCAHRKFPSSFSPLFLFFPGTYGRDRRRSQSRIPPPSLFSPSLSPPSPSSPFFSSSSDFFAVDGVVEFPFFSFFSSGRKSPAKPARAYPSPPSFPSLF